MFQILSGWMAVIFTDESPEYSATGNRMVEHACLVCLFLAVGGFVQILPWRVYLLFRYYQHLGLGEPRCQPVGIEPFIAGY